MKKIVLYIIIMVTMLPFLASCTQNIITTTPPLTTTLPPTTTPPPSVLPEGDLAALVNGNSAFALDLYRKLKVADGNFFYSPYSISTALAMTYAGARGGTAQQMTNTLHFTLTGNNLNAAFSVLDQTFKSRGKGQTVPVEQPGGNLTQEQVEGFRLNIVNALWGQKDYSFLKDYLDVIQQYYGGGFNTLDFIKETEAARLAINKWANDQTNGRIQNLLAPGVLTPMTRLVLTNAIYFKAHWAYEFAKSATSDGLFHLLDGSTVTAQLMHQQHMFSYAEGDNYQAIQLPYLGNDIAMTILLPKEGQFAAFENSLDSQNLNEIIAQMTSKKVNLTLPKFTFDSSFRLDQTLENMGMPEAFTAGTADFSGMNGNRELFIGAVIHKTFVAVDELGTEAAAVTAVAMAGAAMPSTPIDFAANRPFIFLIQDVSTGSILFIGRMANPAA